MIPLDYATPGGPTATRDGDLIVVAARVTRLPPVCVVTGRTAEEAEAAGTRLVPLTMSYDRRIWPSVAATVLTLGCLPLLTLAAGVLALVDRPFRVRGWACRGVWWRNQLMGLGTLLMIGLGMLLCSAAIVFAASASARTSWIAFLILGGIWLAGIALLLGAMALTAFRGEPLRRHDVADGRLRLSGASAALLAALPADSPGNDTEADGTGRAAACEA